MIVDNVPELTNSTGPKSERILYYSFCIGCSDYDLEAVGKTTGKLKAAVSNIK